MGLWTNKGRILTSLGRYEDALRCFDEELELDPDYVKAWFNRAAAEEGLSQWKDAVQSYRQVLKLSPTQAGELFEISRNRLQEMGEQ